MTALSVQQTRHANIPAEDRPSLVNLFHPRSVAVIGATETHGSVGRTLLANLLQNSFGGRVYPVNPKRPNVLGAQAYPNIAAVPGPVDLAVIATPAQTVPEIIKQCATHGVGAAIVVSAGFREAGSDGEELERLMLRHVRGTKMRILGPNCLGIMNPVLGLNASFASASALPGNVAFLSQSGALCAAVLDWSIKEMVGLSAFVSAGSMVDIGWADLIDYFGQDSSTQSILIYMETVGDARAFMSAAREAALKKPIIVLKPGRTSAASRAAVSHTGALTGSDDVLDAAFRRAGVLRVNTIADLFYMAEVLAHQPRPKGPRLTILTNAGGPGVLATDAIISAGGELSSLSSETTAALNAVLPAHWSHNNPVDILGDADSKRYAETVKLLAQDPASDGLLVILTPQAMTNPTETAEMLCSHASRMNKPILTSWMGGDSVAAGQTILNRGGIPTFPYPDTAAKAFHYMWQFAQNLKGLYETPPQRLTKAIDAPTAAAIIQGALHENRPLLDEAESKQLLASYGIPVARTDVARTAEAAVRCAEAIGFPVVVKLYSKTITHKSDVRGVKLNLGTPQAVRTAFYQIHEEMLAGPGEQHFHGVTVQPMITHEGAYETVLGCSVDPQFGPVLLFGAGGRLVEVFKDRALALPPLNATLARLLMEQTRIFRAFAGVRGQPPINLEALETILVAFSQLVLDQPRIQEIDINPLLVSPRGAIALDARVLLYPSNVPDKDIPRPAIRPYPAHYIKKCTLRDGLEVLFRPIRPEDEPLLAEFHHTLSDQTVEARYFTQLSLPHRISHERLSRVCFNDYDREVALVAEVQKPTHASSQIVGVARLVKMPHNPNAEFALVIGDPWQGRGIGSAMLDHLLVVASQEGVKAVRGDIAVQNARMLRLVERCGFTVKNPVDGICNVRRATGPADAGGATPSSEPVDAP